MHVEPAAAFWLDQPQSDRFQSGLYVAARPGVAIGQSVTVQWSYALLMAPPGDGFDQTGQAHFLTTGVRLHPLRVGTSAGHPADGLFADFNLGYVRTGLEDRFGGDVGLGFGFQVGDGLGLGPVIRYGHVVQPNGAPHTDLNDAQFMTAGVSLSMGTLPETVSNRRSP